MAKLTAPNGAKVTVDDSRVDALLRRGFTKPAAKKEAAKKAAAKKSSSK
jgi:hypothetical protein